MSDLIRSWVESANAPDCNFPLNNLPYGVFSNSGDTPRCGVAIGNQIVDASALEASGTLRASLDRDVLKVPYWNDFMELGNGAWSAYRKTLTSLLAEGAENNTIAPYLVPMADATLHMPFRVSEYTDFYAGRHHATNVGTMFRGAENA